jgi:hypothetical protein
MQADALFAAGHSQAQVACQLGVARQNVSRWHARWQAGGLDALRSAGPTGAGPAPVGCQPCRHRPGLRQGARAHGFDTDHWALARITSVVGPASCESCETPGSRDGATAQDGSRSDRCVVAFADPSLGHARQEQPCEHDFWRAP